MIKESKSVILMYDISICKIEYSCYYKQLKLYKNHLILGERVLSKTYI